MAKPIKIGTTAEEQVVVGREHTIDFADEQMPAVLATPWLIWFLEHAARKAVLPSLELGESTVGTFVEIQHLAPTPVGQSVVCQAKVVQVDGPSVSFQLEAHDAHETVARGFHRLRIIRVDRFARRVQAKSRLEKPS
ncbi:MAG: thioesterase [Pirellulaceae bacterium]|nr:MAG: thioesterase [Pirellulaceae bacterium]GIW93906.1 MAG: thioesterase [Pirellulaceae bacterium]